MRENSKPLALTIDAAAAEVSLSKSTIDKAIRAGDLQTKHYGNKTLILSKDLMRWVESLPDGRAAARPQLEGFRTGRKPNPLRSVGTVGKKE